MIHVLYLVYTITSDAGTVNQKYQYNKFVDKLAYKFELRRQLTILSLELFVLQQLRGYHSN